MPTLEGDETMSPGVWKPKNLESEIGGGEDTSYNTYDSRFLGFRISYAKELKTAGNHEKGVEWAPQWGLVVAADGAF